MRNVETVYLIITLSLAVIGVALLAHFQRRDRSDREHLARELANLRGDYAKLRQVMFERLGHERAQQIISSATVPQPDGDEEPRRKRHLWLVPPLAAVVAWA